MSRSRESGLGGDFAGRMMDVIKDDYTQDRNLLRRDLNADGYPPTAAPIRGMQQQLERLESLRAAGDPRGYTAKANNDYAMLQQRVRR